MAKNPLSRSGKTPAGTDAQTGLESYGTRIPTSVSKSTGAAQTTFHKGGGLPATTSKSFGKNPAAGRYSGKGNGGPSAGVLRGKR